MKDDYCCRPEEVQYDYFICGRSFSGTCQFHKVKILNTHLVLIKVKLKLTLLEPSRLKKVKLHPFVQSGGINLLVRQKEEELYIFTAANHNYAAVFD